MIELPQPLYCPRCGVSAFVAIDAKALCCERCEFLYFHNTAGAVAAVIRHDDKVALGTRCHAPGAGLLDFPGGFVDGGETLEGALRRELREELGFEPPTLTYLLSCPNEYAYRGIDYRTVDAYFECRVDERPTLRLGPELAGLEWLRLADVAPSRFASGSARRAQQSLLEC